MSIGLYACIFCRQLWFLPEEGIFILQDGLARFLTSTFDSLGIQSDLTQQIRRKLPAHGNYDANQDRAEARCMLLLTKFALSSYNFWLVLKYFMSFRYSYCEVVLLQNYETIIIFSI